ncbi:MAG: MBL fold metallo-hydrolase [Candidatus Binatia bacterium]|nr:MBL fold metallo-hydrolase [Candidatus Binatia bacterium]
MSQNKSRTGVLLGAVLAVLAAVAALFLLSDDLRTEAKLRAGEAVGNIAQERLEGLVSESGEMERAADLINVPIEARQLTDNVYQARGVGNVQLISTDEGNVIFDTGLSIQAAKQRRVLEEIVPDRPVTHVIVSHSHADHEGGTPFWTSSDTEIVAHREFEEEQRYLKQLEPYFHARNRTLFPFIPEELPNIPLISYGGVEPTIVVGDEPFVFEQGGVRFEVLPTPGAEGADNICLWLPQSKVLLSGDFFGPLFPQFPNIFTMRGEKVRKPIEYIASLDRIIALEPEIIIPSHNNPIEGRDKIRADLVRMRDAVQYVHDETVKGMNAGKTVHQLMTEITLPPELELRQIHGRVSWGVKSIWEYYATWFHFDSTAELYPVPASDSYAAIAELAGVDALVERAQLEFAEGKPIRAIQLLDVALAADEAHVAGLEARLGVLKSLREAAKEGLRNAYEIDWLNSRIRKTQEQLALAQGVVVTDQG